jgi:hypothetical protein
VDAVSVIPGGNEPETVHVNGEVPPATKTEVLYAEPITAEGRLVVITTGAGLMMMVNCFDVCDGTASVTLTVKV